MSSNTPDSSKDSPLLRVYEGVDKTSFDVIQFDLEEKRKHLQEQDETEDFWAGRNLASRNSMRWAA